MYDIKDPNVFNKIAAAEPSEPATVQDVPVVAGSDPVLVPVVAVDGLAGLSDLDLEPATIVEAVDAEPQTAPEDPFTSEEGEEQPAATGDLSEPGDVLYGPGAWW